MTRDDASPGSPQKALGPAVKSEQRKQPWRKDSSGQYEAKWMNVGNGGIVLCGSGCVRDREREREGGRRPHFEGNHIFLHSLSISISLCEGRKATATCSVAFSSYNINVYMRVCVHVHVYAAHSH